MKCLTLGVALFLLTSCFSRSAAMTGETYSMIQLGMSVDDLPTEIGRPYAIHHKENGIKEYEYIERIRNDRSLISENHYLLTVDNGRVVAKRMWQEKPRAYNLIYEYDPNYDSYNSFPSSFP